MSNSESNRDEQIHNRRLLEGIFDSWSRGDIRPFIEAMDDDFRWVFPGSWSWAGTWSPKDVVVQKLLREALGSQLAGPVSQKPDFVLADEDRVVVQSRGFGTTKAGEPYNNTYCFIFRVRNGRLIEVIEHCDTSLVDRVLSPPS
jgi:ketosteroid isomerase-like protein